MVDTTRSQPIPIEEERFRKAYPSLTSLLISWNVSGYGKQEDEEILTEVLKEEDPENLRAAVKEGREFLHKGDFSWEAIRETANYSLPYERWMREWLTWLLDRVEAALSERAPLRPDLDVK
jgi:hypothetical protein